MIGFVVNKKQVATGLLMLLSGIVILIVVCFQVGQVGKKYDALASATTEQERYLFLEQAGYTVDATQPETKQMVEIPHRFSAVYETYQQLQQKAGYDLVPFSGKEVTLYTYQLVYPARTDVCAHLLVYQGKIIGGDITALSADDGFMKPLPTFTNAKENKNGTTG